MPTGVVWRNVRGSRNGVITKANELEPPVAARVIARSDRNAYKLRHTPAGVKISFMYALQGRSRLVTGLGVLTYNP